ncbi:hypothetical protein ACFO3K_16170 [Cellulomonas algicola]|uniref:hypothetical protein n=4 Tax=Cellulomonas algicola TaxID=2071633 RepID=UPI001C3F693B|nr:hypothetical protein [Cellulomonas algicola]
MTVQRWYTNDRTWDPVEPTTGQGTKVDAIVGPGHVYGSGPGTQVGFRPYDYTRLFSAATVGLTYCQGHLLNDNLGGPGKPTAPHAAENLTAFPQKPTNGDHNKGIEEWVKAAAKSSWFRYVVTIGYGTDSAARLRHRLGPGNLALATQAGIAPTATTFTYASSLYAQWEELDASLAATNAAPVVKVGGISGSLSLAIPSPMTFAKVATRAQEYPIAKVTWTHLPKFKGHQTGSWTGTLPPGGAATAPPNPARTHVRAERWRGSDEAQAGTPADATGNAVYQAGYTHYGEGVTDSRAGAVSATRFGRGYLLGYQDFDAGIEHGKKNPLASPPVTTQAAIDGHTELWAGVAKGRSQLLAAPPVGNRAEIAGHAEYWEGVAHARSHAKASPPAGKAAQKAGHDDYWAGVEHAQKSAKGTPPVGNLAQKEAHDAYWDAAEKVTADPSVAAPTIQAGLTAHTEVLETVAFARANVRTAAIATPTLVRTAVWAAYWAGVDLARASAPPTACAGTDAVAKAGFDDYRAGSAQASKDLASLTGAAPAGGGASEGFGDYRSGVEAGVDGQAADAARPAHVRGWTDGSEGVAEGAATTAPSRAEGGYASGHLYGQGAAAARAGTPAPTGATTEDTLAAAGHADYRTGVEAARTDRKAAKPTARGSALGFDEFVAGITTAQAGLRAGPAPTGSEATTAAWTEYWRGVDQALAAPWGTPFAGKGSAEQAGHDDYRSGAEAARASIAALTGAAPATGGAAAGFADYRDGVEDRKAGGTADATRSAQARGWADCGDGMAEAATATPPTRGEGGFASGYLYGHGEMTARAGGPAPAGAAAEDVVAGVGHADYGAGVDAARADRTGPKPTRAAAARGFDEFVAGLAAAQSGVRTGTAPAGSRASAAGWAEYWQGVDAARTAAWGTPYAGASSAERAGHDDYRAGATLARTDLPTMTGAEPAGGGRREGFGDYREGVAHAVDGLVADATRSAHARGWADCTEGVAEGQTGSAPSRTEGGFTSGHLYGQGATTARAGGAAPTATATPQDALAAAGHAHYGVGLAAARADRGATPPTAPGARLGFAEFVDGVDRARAGARTAPPAAGSEARTAGWTEYWRGTDLARTAAWGTGYEGASSAEAAGHADYRAGTEEARAGLAGLTGPRPAGGGEGVGFDDYRAGVEDRKAGTGADAARSGHALGWQDCGAGVTAGSASVDAAPAQTEGGFVSGYLYGQGAARAHAGHADVPGPTASDTIRSTGHAGYTAGRDAARLDLGAPPARLADRTAFDEYAGALAAARTAPRRQAAVGASANAAVTDYWDGVDAARAQPHTVAVATATTAAARGVADYRNGVLHAVAAPAGTQPPATTAAAEGAADYWAGEAHAVGNVAAPGGPAAGASAFQEFDGGRAFARASIPQLQGPPPFGRVAARGFAEYAAGVAARSAGPGNQPARVAFSEGWTDFDAGENDARAGAVVPAQQDSGYLLGFQAANPAPLKRGGSDLDRDTTKKIRA